MERASVIELLIKMASSKNDIMEDIVKELLDRVDNVAGKSGGWYEVS